jgi:mycothiol maleylpyruvate isomerase-like protein/SCP-2 sterol transfer family protein
VTTDDDLFTVARSGLAELTTRAAGLVRSIDDPATPVPNSEWSVGDAAVHLLMAPAVYTDIARGAPSPIDTLDKEKHALVNRQWIADHTGPDPHQLALLLEQAVAALLDSTACRAGDEPVTFHCTLPYDLTRLVSCALGELVVHGYDLAGALSHPWPIDPTHALLILNAYGPLFAVCVNPQTAAGHSAAYRIELRGADGFTARFTDGRLGLEPYGSGAADCTISVDPVAFLLVAAGRLSQWAAIALGLMEVRGPREDLALGFGDLFVFP